MHKLVLPLLTAIVATIAPSAPAHATNVVANPAQIRDVMRKAGYAVEIKGEKEATMIRATRGKDNYSINVSFYGCDTNTAVNCKSVQFYTAFNPKTKPTLEAINNYNLRNRWGRVYRDKVNDPIIEMDVDMEKGGMSEALFLDNLEYYETVMGRFATFVFSAD